MAGVSLFIVTWTAPQATTVILIAFGIACVLTGWGLVNFGHHFAHIWAQVANDIKEADFRLTENFKVEKISQMNDAQLRTLRAGHHVIGVIPGENGPIEKLEGEEVYLYTAWFILVNSTNERLYPISNFKTDTYHFDMLGTHSVDDYTQARDFTLWCVRYGYAEWGRGNQSASWKRPFSPDKILGFLGLDQETYKSEE